MGTTPSKKTQTNRTDSPASPYASPSKKKAVNLFNSPTPIATTTQTPPSPPSTPSKTPRRFLSHSPVARKLFQSPKKATSPSKCTSPNKRKMVADSPTVNTAATTTRTYHIATILNNKENNQYPRNQKASDSAKISKVKGNPVKPVTPVTPLTVKNVESRAQPNSTSKKNVRCVQIKPAPCPPVTPQTQNRTRSPFSKPISPSNKPSTPVSKFIAMEAKPKLTPSPPASPQINKWIEDGTVPVVWPAKSPQRQPPSSVEKSAPSSSPMIFKEPQYRISDHIIGEGAFARIRLASEINTGETVAVKSFLAPSNPTILSEEQKHECENQLKMIRKEKTLLEKLRHPNIIKLHHHKQELNGNLHLYLQYISGGDLYTQVSTKGFIKEADAKKLFIQMIDSVDHCHRNNICHRDIKLENFLIDHDQKKQSSNVSGRVYLIDFGFATPFEGTYQDAMFTDFPGSPGYVCPSIILGHKYNGVAADIYALGVVLYTMLFGRYPFYSPNYHENMRMILYDQPTFSVGRPGQYPPSSQAIDLMRRMLDKNNERRIKMEEIRAHRWLAEFQITFNLFHPSTPTSTSLRKKLTKVELLPVSLFCSPSQVP
jgi:tRNA A-37 threonylcarbamoyl transferase component Bud32